VGYGDVDCRKRCEIGGDASCDGVKCEKTREGTGNQQALVIDEENKATNHFNKSDGADGVGVDRWHRARVG